MNAKQPLFKSAQFWAFTLTPIAISLLIVWSISYKSGMELQWNAEGLKTFYEFFKLPIAILTLSIPLGALAASQHRSVQTAEQIEQQAVQNEFSNRIAHKESFTRFFKDVKPFNDEKINTPWEIYEALFPLNSENGLLPTPQVERIIQQGLDFQELMKAQFDRPDVNREAPPDLVQAFNALSSIKKNLFDLVGAEITPAKITDSRLQVTQLTNIVVTFVLGLIDCANFQRPSIKSFYRSILKSNLSKIGELEERWEAMESTSNLIAVYINSESDKYRKKSSKIREIVDAIMRINSPESKGSFEKIIAELKIYYLDAGTVKKFEALEPELIERYIYITRALEKD